MSARSFLVRLWMRNREKSGGWGRNRTARTRIFSPGGGHYFIALAAAFWNVKCYNPTPLVMKMEPHPGAVARRSRG